MLLIALDISIYRFFGAKMSIGQHEVSTRSADFWIFETQSGSGFEGCYADLADFADFLRSYAYIKKPKANK